MNKPNYILDIPAEQYHADARNGLYLSSHLLGDFRKCPALYHKKMTGEIVRGETEALKFGRATHTLVLEGQTKFNAEYLISDGPINMKTGETYGKATKAYKEWAAAQTKDFVGSSDHETMCKIRTAVWAHEDAATVLDDGFAEGTIRTTMLNEPVQIRMDWFDPERMILGDLKTCRDLDRFQWDIRDFGYVEQMAFYRDVIEIASGRKVEGVYLIGVEKDEPYRCGLWLISDAALDEASEKNRSAIVKLQQCRAAGQWPTGYEGTRVVDVIEQ